MPSCAGKGSLYSLLWEEYRTEFIGRLWLQADTAKLLPRGGRQANRRSCGQRHPAGVNVYSFDYCRVPRLHCWSAPRTERVRTAAALCRHTLVRRVTLYVEASWTQSLPDWIFQDHVRALSSSAACRAGGVRQSEGRWPRPVLMIPDQPTYATWLATYDTGNVVPARPHKPKAKLS